MKNCNRSPFLGPAASQFGRSLIALITLFFDFVDVLVLCKSIRYLWFISTATPAQGTLIRVAICLCFLVLSSSFLMKFKQRWKNINTFDFI